MPAQRRDVGFCSSTTLFKHLSVFRNVAFGLEIRKRPQGGDPRSVTELLDLVHLTQFADRLPAQLSAASASAWPARAAVEPKVLLLDEPFGAPDAKVRGSCATGCGDSTTRVHVTTIFVTHDRRRRSRWPTRSW